jgi:hypothetical protein
MKHVLVNSDTREARVFDSIEAAAEYLATEKAKFAKREGIGMEHVNLSVSEDDPLNVKFSEIVPPEITDSPAFKIGVQHALWATAHLLRKNGKTVSAELNNERAHLLMGTRDADFDLLHGLGDEIAVGKTSAIEVIDDLYAAGDAHN